MDDQGDEKLSSRSRLPGFREDVEELSGVNGRPLRKVRKFFVGEWKTEQLSPRASVTFWVRRKPDEDTPAQEIRRLDRIQKHWAKLSDAGKEYLLSWMEAHRP